jgi:hypothetical protein
MEEDFGFVTVGGRPVDIRGALGSDLKFVQFVVDQCIVLVNDSFPGGEFAIRI